MFPTAPPEITNEDWFGPLRPKDERIILIRALLPSCLSGMQVHREAHKQATICWLIGSFCAEKAVWPSAWFGLKNRLYKLQGITKARMFQVMCSTRTSCKESDLKKIK